MKFRFLLAGFAIASLLFSCTATKKTFKDSSSRSDSTGKTVIKETGVIKKDSIDKVKTETTEVKKVDSGYTKVTVIKEYFGDEIDFDGPTDPTPAEDYFPPDTTKPAPAPAPKPKPKPKPTGGGLTYRETTITETGQVNKSDSTQKTEEHTTNVNHSDSTAKDNSHEAQTSTEANSSEGAKTKFSLLKYWWVVVIVLVLIYFFFPFKKQNNDS